MLERSLVTQFDSVIHMISVPIIHVVQSKILRLEIRRLISVLYIQRVAESLQNQELPENFQAFLVFQKHHLLIACLLPARQHACYSGGRL